MRRAAVVALALLLTGCLGTVTRAGIPQEDLDEAAWTLENESSRSLAWGFVELVTRRYGPTGSLEGTFAGVAVVSATDAPLVDERRFIPEALAAVERAEGVRFAELGDRSLTFLYDGMGTIAGTEYDVQGAPAQAKALVLAIPCDSFVLVIAYGVTTPMGSTLFGGSTVPYNAALDMAERARCAV